MSDPLDEREPPPRKGSGGSGPGTPPAPAPRDPQARWQTIERLFHLAVQVPKKDRDAFLDEECGADQPLRSEVESLLRADESAARFLEEPAPGLTPSPSSDPEVESLLVGKRIGHYRVVRLIAAGGMSLVYEARQEHPRRRVALKVLHRGLASRSAIHRFELEGRILGVLNHPGIAHIYETGIHREGLDELPYFAMELIEGCPPTVYAKSGHLDLRSRLKLFCRIGEAVQHAHQKGVIHRDLKPSNILVDDTGSPKVLDFGVARVLDTSVQSTSHTLDGQLIGTVQYMSPEQTRGSPDEVDTRSDVYSLGVLLFEMVSDELPYAIRGQPITEAVRTICETDARPLSSVAGVRRSDLDTIVAKALEKDRERRYPGVAELVSDIQSYLKGEPIKARSPSAVYQLQRFAGRNKALVAGMLAFLLAIVLGVVGTGLGLLRAERETEVARQQAERADRIKDFILTVLVVSGSPDDAEGEGEVTVKERLDQACRRLESSFADEPRVKERLHHLFGESYRSVGEHGKAARQILASIALRRQTLGGEDRTVADRLMEVAEIYQDRLKDYERATEMLTEAARVLDELRSTSQESVVEIQQRLATVWRLRGDDEMIETCFNRLTMLVREKKLLGQERYRRFQYDYLQKLISAEKLDLVLRVGDFLTPVIESQNGKESQELGTHYHTLALAARRARQLPRAESYYRKALAIRKAQHGERHIDVLISTQWLGEILYRQRKFEEAKPLFQTLVEFQRLFPEMEQERIDGLGYLGCVHHYLDDRDAAMECFEEAASVRERDLGGRRADEAYRYTRGLAEFLYVRGDYTNAARLSARLLQTWYPFGSPEDPRTSALQDLLGRCHYVIGRFEEARSELEAAARQAPAKSSDAQDAQRVAARERNLGVLLIDQELFRAAEPHLLRAIQILEGRVDGEHPELRLARLALGDLYLATGRAEAAGDLLSPLADLAERSWRHGGWIRAYVRAVLGEHFLAGEQRAAAIAWLEEARDLFSRFRPPDDPRLRRISSLLTARAAGP